MDGWKFGVMDFNIMVVKRLHFAKIAQVIVKENMKIPKKPLTKEAYEFLKQKKDRMGKLERDKTIKRLEMFDRGYKAKDDGE